MVTLSPLHQVLVCLVPTVYLPIVRPKFAAVGIAESLAVELTVEGKSGVKTTCVCPFYISTGMFEGATTGEVQNVYGEAYMSPSGWVPEVRNAKMAGMKHWFD